MEHSVTVGFRNLGWRSWLSCSLCADCPDSDAKGCCSYSPIFGLADLALLQAENPQILRKLLEMPRLTVLDYSLTVQSVREANGTLRCQLHTREQGCILPVQYREFVCRRYVCEGLNVWEHPKAGDWLYFFDELEAWEARLNRRLEQKLRAGGVTLRKDQIAFFTTLGAAFGPVYCRMLNELPDSPANESIRFSIDVTNWNEWQK